MCSGDSSHVTLSGGPGTSAQVASDEPISTNTNSNYMHKPGKSRIVYIDLTNAVCYWLL